MHQRLLEVTDTLESASKALLADYEPQRLYAFRVAARRIRSILKQIDNHRSRGLRKTWGGFAAVTGSARDWDVFVDSAGSLLDADDLGKFSDINRQRIESSHEAVVEMLRSAHWSRHLADWKQFLESAPETSFDPGAARSALELALQKSFRRRLHAMENDCDHRWHKYRIAVKEVRYVAEANPNLDGAKRVAESCKPLQTMLGDWHDTVVQLNLLEELPPATAHDRLAVRIRDRKTTLLSEIRASPPLDQPVW
jgi:CHAD domain-containing protein